MKNNRGWLCLLFLPLLALSGLAEERAAPEAGAVQPTEYIALTFDDSPNAALTERLLDGLKERGAHATFFVIGEQLEGQEALVLRMKEEGHQIGNHTWTHCRLDNTGSEGARELARTEEALERLLGGKGYWIRPPWGFAAEETLREAGTPLLYWSVDTKDWSLLDADRVTEAIVENAKDGDIVLLHDAYATSVDAALRAIDRLSGRGCEFVTVAELFERMGIEPEPGCFYCRPDELRAVSP